MWNLLSHKYKNFDICLNGSKSYVIFLSLFSSVRIVPQKITKPFTQESEDTTRQFGGTGLGLSIVSSLIKLHNSELIIKSKLGE